MTSTDSNKNCTNLNKVKILAFDTTNSTASVAISEGQKILAYIEEMKPSMQAEKLLDMIEEALDYSQLTYSDIDYLAVTNGPGSFTGIRIGLAAATGILLGSSMQSTAITNFEIAYFRAVSQIKSYDQVIILLNAFRTQLYVQIFPRGNASISVTMLLDYEVAIDLIRQQQGQTICAGSGTKCIYEAISALPSVSILPRFVRIKATDLCRYLDQTISSRISQAIEPLYIRNADAISNHLNRHTDSIE